MHYDKCEVCGNEAEGELMFEDGESLVGCGPCLIEIVLDPTKPVYRIVEYEKFEQ